MEKFFNALFGAIGYLIILVIQLLIPSLFIKAAVLRLFNYELDLMGIFCAMVALLTLRMFVFYPNENQD